MWNLNPCIFSSIQQSIHSASDISSQYQQNKQISKQKKSRFKIITSQIIMPIYLNFFNSHFVTGFLVFNRICNRIYAHFFLFNIYIFFEVYLLILYACHSWRIFRSYLSKMFIICWPSTTIMQIQKTGSVSCLYYDSKTVWDDWKNWKKWL